MPDKSPDAFRTISEVAEWLGVQPHVLRFWESKFSQVRPVKRAGGRRYYRPNDMLLLGGIRKLLHEDGLTIKGAQKVLREEGMSHVARLSQPLDPESAALSDLAASAQEAPAEEHAPEPAESEPETGQLLDFGSAQRARPEQAEARREQTAEPAAEEPAERSQPDLTGAEPEVAADAAAPVEPTLPPEASAHRDNLPQEEAAEKATDQPTLPSFVRHGATKKPAEPEKPAAEKPAPPVSDGLPSFLQQPAVEEDTSPAVPEASEDTPVEAKAEVEDAEATPGPDHAPAPKPRIVEAPDPDESSFDVSSGALSASFVTTSLSAERRARVLPLVAQLAALRDRMAAARGR